ncbi:MAG: hypothetical protein IKD69_10525 [Solobacterium sp.]|jgi:hypothetical protein|nr:hypothetical protein [Solobacterium sp.]
MDELILALSKVSEQFLPILGAVALIFLCMVLNRAAKLVSAITDTVKGLDPTLRLVDRSIEKVQAPLDTVVRYSHSLDKVHDKTSETLAKAADFASENIDQLKTKLSAMKEDVTPAEGEEETE